MWAIEKKHLLMGLALLCAIIFGLGFKAGQIREQQNFKPVISQGLSEKEINTEDAMDTEGAAGTEGAADIKEALGDDKAGAETVTISVHVAGAVEKPGVYTFPENARVLEGVNKAVPAKDADLSGINLAEIMADQQQVIVPRRGETAGSGGNSSASGGSGNTAQTGSGRKAAKININTAGTAELATLPGIGPATAQKIIDQRKKQGGFKDIREIMNVSGIGEKKYSDIKDRITV